MFEFFRDMALEFSGIDSKAADEERKEKKEMKKKDRYIFSTGMKVLVWVVGVLYLVVVAMSIYFMKQAGAIDILNILRYIVMVSIDVAAMICLAIGNKKTEIAAVILIPVFILLLYFGTLLM